MTEFLHERDPEKLRSEDPPVIRCQCGSPLTLDDCMTNTCDCGTDYNGSGQLLAPREQWGEETGEHWTDIMRPIQDHEWGSY